MDGTMAKFVLVSGISGCGKSKILGKFNQEYRGKTLVAMDFPHFMQEFNSPFASQIEQLNQIFHLAIQEDNFLVKTNCLIAFFMYYRPVLNLIEKQANPSIIISQHHPVLDTLFYSLEYTKNLELSEDFHSICEFENRFNNNSEVIEINRFLQRSLFDRETSLFNLHLKLKQIVNADDPDAIFTIIKFFNIRLPEIFVHLLVAPDELHQRQSNISPDKYQTLEQNIYSHLMVQKQMQRWSIRLNRELNDFYYFPLVSDEPIDLLYQKSKKIVFADISRSKRTSI
jgi:hypothetical protein